MEEKKMNISIAPDKAAGTYSNLAVIAHSQSEFVVDFASVLPGIQQANVQSRIIMTPENTKRLLLALQDNVAKYEKQFGTVTISGAPAPGSTLPISFGLHIIISSSCVRPTLSLPPIIAVVAGIAPLARTISSTLAANSIFCGYGIPWLRIVLSSPTTGLPAANASAISGLTSRYFSKLISISFSPDPKWIRYFFI